MKDDPNGPFYLLLAIVLIGLAVMSGLGMFGGTGDPMGF